MTAEQFDRVGRLFDQACELAEPDRRAFLDAQCGDDPAVRGQVEALLAEDQHPPAFLDESAVAGFREGAAAEVAQERLETVSATGRYRITKKIAEGGFGAVYAAEQLAPLRRPVALKIVKLGMDTRELIARFEGERQALALMDHPNIAKVFDAGATDSGRPFFVMELVHGEPITEYCDRHALTLRSRIELFVQVCHAVQHAHEKGIVHRDVKPNNVLITTHDGTPAPKVIDFGIAKALAAPLTDKTLLTGQWQMIGTPAYMSPEQAALTGEDVDSRSDVYSLGALLYELLTGDTPFSAAALSGAGLVEVQRMIRDLDPPKPSTRLSSLREGTKGPRDSATKCVIDPGGRRTDPKSLVRQLRGDLDWIVMKALEKDRRRRYQTARALAEDIQRHLQDRPVLAGPPSAAYRLVKLLRRRRGLAAAAAVVICAASFMAVVMRGRDIRTLAVLPLRDSSANDEDAYFADGMTETLIGQLEGLDSVQVIAGHSVMQFKDAVKRPRAIAAELKADALIEGSVQRLADRVRIEVRLLHAPTEQLLWSGSYERKLQDVLALQSEVARSIAGEIQVTLTPRERKLLAAPPPAVNPQAYDAYLRGRFHWNKRTRRGIDQAIELFGEAVRLAPDYARAHAGLADAHLLLTPYGGVPARESYPAAKSSAKAALAIDPGLGQAYASLAVVEHEYDWRTADAERHFRQAIELSPNYATARQWYAEFLTRMGRHDAAIEQIERARQLDPLSLIINSVAGWVYHYAGDSDRAIRQLEATLEMEADFVPAHGYLGMACEANGEYARAIDAYQAAYRLSGGNPRYLSDLAVAWARAGDPLGAQGALTELLARAEADEVHAFLVARVYAALGAIDPALEWLERGHEQRGVWMLFIKIEPLFDSLRGHPRFRELIHRIGFEP